MQGPERQDITGHRSPSDAFERFYFALRRPLCGSQCSGVDMLIVGVLAAETVHISFQRVPGLLTGLAPSVAVGVLTAVAFLGRRRAPLPTALLSLAGLALNGSRVPVFFALYALAKYGGRYRFAAIAACAGAYLPLTLALPGGMGLDSFVRAGANEDVLSTSVLMTIPVLSGLGAASYERTIHALHAREHLLAQERERRTVEAKAAERLRLAREMHDMLGHRIALMAMHAGALEMAVRHARPQGGELARSLGDTARDAMRDLREVVSALRDVPEGPLVGSVPGDLDELIAVSRESGLRVSFASWWGRAGHRPEAMDPQLCVVLYRTVQESLTNAMKHAPGAAVSVSLTVGRQVVVRVTNTPAERAGRLPAPGDGGPGEGGSASGGFGLLGLRERVTARGGDFSAGTTQAGGWEVRAVLPNDPPPVCLSPRGGPTRAG
ncbi:sensor histidine kinase [Streptomyces lavendulae]